MPNTNNTILLGGVAGATNYNALANQRMTFQECPSNLYASQLHTISNGNFDEWNTGSAVECYTPCSGPQQCDVNPSMDCPAGANFLVFECRHRLGRMDGCWRSPWKQLAHACPGMFDARGPSVAISTP